jgi:hypothetical protein
LHLAKKKDLHDDSTDQKSGKEKERIGLKK